MLVLKLRSLKDDNILQRNNNRQLYELISTSIIPAKPRIERPLVPLTVTEKIEAMYTKLERDRKKAESYKFNLLIKKLKKEDVIFRKEKKFVDCLDKQMRRIRHLHLLNDTCTDDSNDSDTDSENSELKHPNRRHFYFVNDINKEV